MIIFDLCLVVAGLLTLDDELYSPWSIRPTESVSKLESHHDQRSYSDVKRRQSLEADAQAKDSREKKYQGRNFGLKATLASRT